MEDGAGWDRGPLRRWCPAGKWGPPARSLARTRARPSPGWHGRAAPARSRSWSDRGRLAVPGPAPRPRRRASRAELRRRGDGNAVRFPAAAIHQCTPAGRLTRLGMRVRVRAVPADRRLASLARLSHPFPAPDLDPVGAGRALPVSRRVLAGLWEARHPELQKPCRPRGRRRWPSLLVRVAAPAQRAASDLGVFLPARDRPREEDRAERPRRQHPRYAWGLVDRVFRTYAAHWIACLRAQQSRRPRGFWLHPVEKVALTL